MKKVLRQQYYVWPNILPTKHLLFKLQFSKFVKRYFHGTIVKIIYRMIDLNFMVVNFPCRKLNNSSSTATYSHVVSFFIFCLKLAKPRLFFHQRHMIENHVFQITAIMRFAEECHKKKILISN